MSERLIILAEDDDKLRRMYSDMLESAGFKVMRACDGEMAIGLLHKIPNPHLIILDVMMPGIDGIETCIRMRKMQGLRPCPIVFLTALNGPENILECLRAGGDDYLMKSAPMAEFLYHVRYWLRQKPSDERSATRNKAIKELESIVSGGAHRGSPSARDEEHGVQASMSRLVTFINGKTGSFSDNDDMLYRFGYMVGLVEAHIPSVGKNQEDFNQFMCTLVFKTSIIERKSIDSLLKNYLRIINQSLFQKGWMLGREDACEIDLPIDVA